MSNYEERQLYLGLDDSDLQKGAKSAIQTLEKLDEAFKFSGAAESIDNLQNSLNSVDFSRLADNVEIIAKRASFLGVVGEKIIGNLTDRVANFAIKTLHNLNPLSKAIGIVNAGINQTLSGGRQRATKIDQAKFKIEGLGQEWDKVSQRVDYGVTDTAYGFDQAANAAAQLVAAGVKMSDVWDPNNVDELGVAMRALSGVAAITGANYDMISDVFIDSAAAGKVTTDALNRLAWQGLNAKKVLADAFGVTQEEVGKMATKGEISFDRFSKAMDEAYGEQATKSNETFEGSLDNMKAALNRIGAEFFFPIRKAGTQIFNATRLQLKAFKNLLGSTTDEVDDQFVDKFATVVGKGSDIISRFISSIPVESFKGIIDYGGQVLDTISDLMDAFSGWMDSIPWLAKKEEESATSTADAVEQMAYSEEHILDLANRAIRGDFGNGEERRATLEAMGECYELVQNKVNELKGSTFRYDVAMKESTETTKEAAEATKEETDAQWDQMDIMERVEEVHKGVMNSFKQLADSQDRAEKRAKALSGLKDAFLIVGNVILSVAKGAIEPLTDLFGTIRDGFLNGTSSLGTWLSNFRTILEESGAYSKIQNATNFVLGKVVFGFKELGKVGKLTFKGITAIGGKVFGVLGQVKDQTFKVWDAFKKTEGYEVLSAGFNAVKDTVGNAWNFIYEKISGFFDWLSEKNIKLPAFDADAIADGISNAITWVRDHIGSLRDGVLDLFSNIPIDFNGLKEAFQNIFSSLTEDPFAWAQARLTDIRNLIKEIIETFTGKSGEAGEDGKKSFISDLIEGALSKVEDLKAFFDGNLLGTSFADILGGALEGFNALKEHFIENIGTLTDLSGSIGGILGTIGEAIKLFFETISGSIFGVTVSADPMEEVTDTLYDVAYNGEEGQAALNTVADTFNAATEGFNNAMTPIKEFFENLKTQIMPIAERVGEFLAPLKDDLPKTIEDVPDTIVSLLQKFIAFKAIQGGAGALGALWNFSGILKQVKKGGKNINKILKSFKGIGKSVKKILNSAVEIPKGIAKIPVSISKVIDEAKLSVKKVTDGFVSIENSFAKALKGEARLRNAKALLILVAAIGILAFVVAELTKVDWQTDNARTAVLLMILLIGAVGVLMYVMGKVFTGKDSKLAAKGGDKMAEVLKQYKGIVKDFLKSIGKAATIAAIGMAVTMIGAVVVALALIPWQKGIKGVIFTGLILFGLVKALGSIDKMTGGGLKAKVGVLAVLLGIALNLLAGVVKKLGKLSLWSGLKGVGFLYIIILELTEALKPIANMEIKGSVFKKIVLMIATIAVLKQMVGMVETFGKMKFGSLVKGLLGVVIITEMLGSVIKKMASMEHAKAGPIVALSFAIMALTGSMVVLGNMKTKKLVKAGAAILTISHVLKKLLKQMPGMKDVKAGPILALVAVFGAIVAALKILGDMDGDSLRNATLAISAVMGVLSLLTWSIGTVTKGPNANWKTIIASLLPILGALAGAVGALLVLDHFVSDANRLSVIADALSKVMVALAAIVAATSLLPQGEGGGGAKSSLASNAVAFLEGIEWGAFAAALILALGALSDLYEKFVPDKVKETITYWVDTGKQLIFDIADFIGAVIGHLAKGILTPILSLIIGDKGLPDAVEKLGQFVDKIVPFVTDSDKIPENGPDAVNKLVQVLLAMGAAALAGIVGKILANFLDMDSWDENTGVMGLMTWLERFMEEYKKFDEKLANFKPTASSGQFNKVQDVLLEISRLGLTSIVSSIVGNVLGAIDGTDENSNILLILNKIGTFIQGYQIFQRKLSHIDTSGGATDKIERIGDVIRALNGVALPASLSGLFNWIIEVLPGDNGSVGATGIMTKLTEFLRAYIEFQNVYADVTTGQSDVEKINSVVATIDAFSDAGWSGAGAENANEAFSFVTDDGKTGATQLVEKLRDFLDAYVRFYPWLAQATADPSNQEKIEQMGKILGSFAGMSDDAKKVTENNDLITVDGTTNKTGLEEMVEKLKAFLVAYIDFYPKLVEAVADSGNIDKITQMGLIIGAFTSVTGEAKKLVEGNDLIKVKAATGETGLTEILGKLGGFLDKYDEFYDKLKTMPMSFIAIHRVNAMKTVISAFADSAWEAWKGSIATFWLGDNGLANLVTTVGDGVGTLIETLKQYGADVSEVQLTIANIKSIFSMIKDISDFAINSSAGYTAEQLDAVNTGITSMFQTSARLFADANFSEPLKAVGRGLFDLVVQGFDEAAGGNGDSTSNNVNGILSRIFSSDSITDAEKEQGKQLGFRVVQAMLDWFGTSEIPNTGKVENYLSNLFGNIVISGILDDIKAMETSYGEEMEALMTVMQHAIQNSKWRFTVAMSVVLNAMIRTAKNFQNSFKDTGDYIMQGFEKGINDKFDTITKSVRDKTDTLLNGMNQVAEVNSPSKRTLRLGLSIMEGLQMGIDEGAPFANRSATDAATSMLRTMSDSVTTEADNTKQQLFNSLVGLYSLVNMAINEAVDTQPTITPVMDLSMIQNGVNGINGMLGRGYSFGANSLAYARSMFPGITAYNAQTAAQMSTQSAIQGIREDIRYLGETIGNMQMVLDSGTLVGSISGGMDKQLGGIQRMKERWA